MKKGIISLVFLFIVMNFAMNIVYAEAYTSDYIDAYNASFDHEGENLKFTNVIFTKLEYKSDQETIIGLLDGGMVNTSNFEVNVPMKIEYFNSDLVLIAVSEKTEKPSPSSTNYRMNIILYQEDLLGDYSVNDIKYYKVSYESKPIETSFNDSTYYDYLINKYDINVVVNENNTFDVTETITAYFNEYKHGIYRTIPTLNEIERGGSVTRNRAQITNIYSSEKFTKSMENGNLVIKIGDKNKTLIGEKTYEIKYSYNIGKDPLKDSDEFYFNLIGNNWETNISNVTFSITMPKDFDSSNIHFTHGQIGSTDNSNINYSVDGRKITGYYDGKLNAFEGITVKVNLEDGYFSGADLKRTLLDYLMFIAPITFLVISIIIWYRYGNDEKIVETVEFRPPDGITSLDAALIYKGSVNEKDVTSLLIYLANKGYIEIIDPKIDLNSKVSLSNTSKQSANKKIEELKQKIENEKNTNPNSKKIKYYENMLDIYSNIDTPIDYEGYGLKSSIKNLNKKAKFIIRKLRDYDGDSLEARWFMEGLFEFGKTEVTDKDLYNRFYKTVYRIINNINDTNHYKIFSKEANDKGLIVMLFMILTYEFICVPPSLNYSLYNIFIVQMVPFIAIIFLFAFGRSNFDPLTIILSSLFVIASLFVILSNALLKIILCDHYYLAGTIVCLTCIVLMFICLLALSKRTSYGHEMLGKLKGFKRFLESAEKEKLESLVNENPNYYYDILPYAYVLGVSNKWIKKFESINLQAPDWYESSSSFNSSSFNSFLNKTVNSSSSSMLSRPSTSSGSGSSGGSSGGGSSGGGSGGGGGGSW